MRGAGGAGPHGLHRLGIIPAHAGSSRTRVKPRTIRQDHPRACGEQALGIVHAVKLMGSSPRMRGAGANRHEGVGLFGIIPAHAGSRASPPTTSCSQRDHPRACGEQCVLTSNPNVNLGSSPRMRGAGSTSRLASAHPSTSWGSSPRMRGAAARDAARRPQGGIIPAHAGSSRGRSPRG